MILGGYSWVTARSSFALGLGCGLLLASAGFVVLGRYEARASGASGPGGSWSASNSAWRHPGASADLTDAVRVSAGLLAADRSVPAGEVAAPPTGSLQEMLARAEQHRRQREFEQACALYAAVAAQGGMTADTWADYADAQASATGRLAGAPARAIEAALALDPRHAKALWLKASLAHEERRYADALTTWRQLRALVPPGSSDAKIIQTNIAEASRLVAG